MVEEIEETLQEITVESDDAAKELINPNYWNDEDLDQALEQQKRFDAITRKLRRLNDHTMEVFNENQEEAYGLLPQMRTLHEACVRNVGSLLGSKIAEALKSIIESFQDEIDQLQENIDDFVLIHDELANDEEWQDILSHL